jgi:hypothetical protein
MTGIADYNYPEFNRVAKLIRDMGYEVENPADSEKENTEYAYQAAPHEWYMRKAIEKITTCNAVVLLNGWENSSGAKLEVDIARGLGLPMWGLKEFQSQYLIHKFFGDN